eukprot:TRINITY_DN3874_c0_g1_i3.p1 TRINITY_DN3874_c0_g1~~TRINITY_DN3874_c0_g1_i3.p1  ORF type:complete len:141 (+),score=29.74 TRINITY_DN3874_c0_g1_i3:1734-2156(+)
MNRKHLQIFMLREHSRTEIAMPLPREIRQFRLNCAITTQTVQLIATQEAQRLLRNSRTVTGLPVLRYDVAPCQLHGMDKHTASCICTQPMDAARCFSALQNHRLLVLRSANVRQYWSSPPNARTNQHIAAMSLNQCYLLV